MNKEAIDDHIGRYVRRIQLGLRFLGHGARAHTTCQWTGLTPDQLVTVRRRSKFNSNERLRGPSPSSFTVFFRSNRSSSPRSVIMLAWHLAQTRASCARLVLGASPATVAVIAAMPVASVERVARRVCLALSARFGSRTRFWLQFEGCAAQPNERSFAMLRQLGLQIQGAESARGQALQRRFGECRS